MAYREKSKILGEKEIEKIIKRLTHQILEKNLCLEEVCLVGIQRRGVFLAGRIKRLILEIEGKELSLGAIDITLYRDDLTAIGPAPQVGKTEINFDINNKVVILVDDVLFTGRTVRSALDEVIDFGRPKRIELVVLIDRGHRELPIRADFVGKNIPTSSSEIVEVRLKELDGKDEVVILEEDA